MVLFIAYIIIILVIKLQSFWKSANIDVIGPGPSPSLRGKLHCRSAGELAHRAATATQAPRPSLR